MIPKTTRNPAETDEPMIPPMRPYLSKSSRTVAAVAATTMEVIITMLGICQNDLFDKTRMATR
jgi:hypothetical protein